MPKILRTVLTDERGAQLVEYGLLAGLIALVVLVSVTVFGQNVSSLFTPIAGSI